MIVGAGLAGLIAAHAFPNEPIIEAEPEPTSIHKALLRFRSSKVGDLLGIEFRPVIVDKSIWFEGREVSPSIRFTNLYSEKVIGKLLPRSIRHTESVKRYIAPSTLYEILISRLEGRIEWGNPYDFRQNERASNVVNTAPLSVPLAAFDYTGTPCFRRAGIVVERLKVAGSDVYQTIYFPSPETPLYRASITGDLLICEFTKQPDDYSWQGEVTEAFGLGYTSVETIETVSQKYGKIAPIDEKLRKMYVADLTAKHDIFSLGRFATWRNILLDDLINDIAVIKKLRAASPYDRNLIGAK